MPVANRLVMPVFIFAIVDYPFGNTNWRCGWFQFTCHNCRNPRIYLLPSRLSSTSVMADDSVVVVRKRSRF